MIFGGFRPWGPHLWAPAPLEVSGWRRPGLLRALGRGRRYLWLLSRISSQQGQEVMNCRE